MSILRLKEILKEQDLTGKELALKVGVSQPAMSDIVKGKSYPRPALLLKIAKTLDLDVKELFKPTKNHEPIYLIIENKLHTFNSKSSFIEFVIENHEPLKKSLLHYGKKKQE